MLAMVTYSANGKPILLFLLSATFYAARNRYSIFILNWKKKVKLAKSSYADDIFLADASLMNNPRKTWDQKYILFISWSKKMILIIQLTYFRKDGKLYLRTSVKYAKPKCKYNFLMFAFSAWSMLRESFKKNIRIQTLWSIFNVV